MLDLMETSTERQDFLHCDILEAARRLSLRGDKSGLVSEIRDMAQEHLRIELESARYVLIMNGQLFGEIAEPIEIERMFAVVLFRRELYVMSWLILRKADQPYDSSNGSDYHG